MKDLMKKIYDYLVVSLFLIFTIALVFIASESFKEYRKNTPDYAVGECVQHRTVADALFKINKVNIKEKSYETTFSFHAMKMNLSFNYIDDAYVFKKASCPN